MFEITQEWLKERYHYDPDTGEFYSKYRNRNKPMGVKRKSDGRVRICIGYKKHNYKKVWYRARLAYLYYHGWLPDQVDHRDNVRHNDKITNLRPLTNQDNSRNAGIGIRNTSGTVGVHWHKRWKCWEASIRVDYKLLHLGNFKKYEDAVKARKEAEQQYKFDSEHGKKPSFRKQVA